MRFSGRIIYTFAVVVSAALVCPTAHADSDRAPRRRINLDPTLEISVMGSYSKTDYGDGTYETSRRYTGTIGWFFTATSELELSYDNSFSFLNSDPVQTSSTAEQSLGLSLIQQLTPPHSMFEPYLKGGAGQYNREQTGTVSGVPTLGTQSKSPCGILGGGIRIHIWRAFSLKAEGTAYLPNFNISGAVNNFNVQGGLSLEFY